MAKALFSSLANYWNKQGQDPPYAAAAGVGFTLLLIPLYFVSASLLNQFGIKWLFAPIEQILSHPRQAAVFNFVSPFLLLGALTLSLVLNLTVVVSRSRRPAPGGAVSGVGLRVKFWNLVTVASSLLLIGLLLGYAFVENFSIRL
jgi:hypothetical protein